MNFLIENNDDNLINVDVKEFKLKFNKLVVFVNDFDEIYEIL